MIGLAELILYLIAWLVIPTSLTLWIVFFGKTLQGYVFVPWAERRRVPWEFIDILLAVFVSGAIILTSQRLAAGLLNIDLHRLDGNMDNLEPGQHFLLLLAVSLGFALASAMTLLMIRFRTRATIQDFGFSSNFILHDISYGLCGFAMLIVPVLTVQFVLSRFFPDAAGHPFVDLLRKDPSPVWLGIVFVAAVVIAPVVEEFLFRVIFQGWLERLFAADERKTANDRATENRTRNSMASDGDETDNDNYDAQTVSGKSRNDLCDGRDSYPYQTPVATSPPMPMELVISGRTRWLPIVISSTAFAMAHFNHGTAPFALFVLALGLGYLYQRTHRIWACIVVHVLVNLLATLQLQMLIDSQK